MNELSKLSDQELPRLSVKEMSNETMRFFNFEKGIPFTYISLLKNPLGTVKTYLNVNRRRYFNPLNYTLIAVGLYTIIVSFHKGFQSFLRYTEAKNKENFAVIEKQFNIKLAEPLAQAQEIIFSYQNVLYLLIIPAISLITFWLFRKKYNYAEHLAVNAFVFGTSTWTGIILALLTAYIDQPIVIFTVLPIISFGVIIYLYKKIFESSWWGAIGTMLLVYLVIMIIQIIVQFGLMAFLMV